MSHDVYGPPWENVPGLHENEVTLIRLLRACGPSHIDQLHIMISETMSRSSMCVHLALLKVKGILQTHFERSPNGSLKRLKMYTLSEEALEEWGRDRARHLQIEGRFIRRNKT